MKYFPYFLAVLSTAFALIIPAHYFGSNVPSELTYNETIYVGPASSRNLQARALLPPSDDATWDRLVCKGNKLVMLMKANDKDAGALLEPPQDSARSQFTNFPGELEKWGYKLQNDADTDFSEYHYGLSDMMRDIGVSWRKDDWKFWFVTHGDQRPGANLNEQTYVVNDKEYRATGGMYKVLVNSKDQMMVFAARYGVAFVGGKRNPPVVGDMLLQLQRACDICWGLWTTIAGTGPLKHLVAWAISNDVTNAAISRALKQKEVERVPYWPGINFPTDTDEGKALLGTPNGVGVGYMLAQHKYPLGNRVVKNIKIFLTDSVKFDEKVNMYFEIGPA